MRSKRHSKAKATAAWSWRAAAVAGAIAAASGGGCATDPPPRPAQIDPSNPGAPESRPLEVRSDAPVMVQAQDRKSTRLNSSHTVISYAVFCLKKKNKI